MTYHAPQSTPKQAAAEHLGTYLLRVNGGLTRYLMSRGFSSEAAEEAIQNLALTFFRDLEKYDTSSLGPDYTTWPLVLERWDPKYLKKSAYNAACHVHRQRRFVLEEVDHERSTIPPVTTGEPPRVPDDVPGYLDRMRRLTALRITLTTLVARGERMTRGTFISPAHFRTYVAVREAYLAGVDALGPAASSHLGIKTSSVNTDMKRLSDTLVRTRYIVGVLGGRGRLLSTAAIDETLDMFDDLPSQVKSPIRDAARYVRTMEQTGTRVDLHAYPWDEQDLHQDEASVIDAVASNEPNCVLICGMHTADAHRITEF